MPMNILIADDHVMFRDTLQHYIERAQPSYRLLMVSNLKGVTDTLDSKAFIPDLCIIDYKMPGMKGVQTFEKLIKSYPLYSFAVMSGMAEKEDIERVLDAGVSGYLPKTLSGRLMLKAIDTMLEGKKFIPYGPAGEKIAPSYFSDPAMPRASADIGLTAREKDVLKLLGQGKSNRDIAEALELKIVTIKLHMRGIFRKLGCDNRTRAVLKAKEMGIIE